MPSRGPSPIPEPVELSLEDMVLDTWLEDTGEYLRIDAPELTPLAPPDAPPADRS
jgi:hypothetical protein